MNGLDWTIDDVGRVQHVTPLYDTYPHMLDVGCWCRPTPDSDFECIIVHNSADGREAFERGERRFS